MDERWAVFLVFLFGDEHWEETAQRRQDGSSHPGRKLPFWRVEYVDFHRGRSQGNHFFLQPLLQVLQHACPSSDHDIPIKVFSNV